VPRAAVSVATARLSEVILSVKNLLKVPHRLIFLGIKIEPYYLRRNCSPLRASFSFLTDRLSYLLTNWLRQAAFPVSLIIS